MRWSAPIPAFVGLLLVACPPSEGETESGPETTTSTGSSSSTTGTCPVGSLGCACTSGGACDPNLSCVAEVCVDLGPTTSTTSTSTSTTGTTTSDTTSTSSTTSDSDGAECDPRLGLKNEACPAELPYCSVSGVCGDCSVLVACADADPATPVCDLESGACVQCTSAEDDACTGTTPICDMLTRTCVGCSTHSECPNSACNIATGACLPEDNVISVYPDAPANGKCTGMVDGGKPYCYFDVAIQHAKKYGFSAGWTIRMLKGPEVHTTASITGTDQPATIAVLAYDDKTSAPEFQDVSVPMKVTGLAGKLTVYLDNLDVISLAGVSDLADVECSNATLYVTRSRIRGGAGPGVRSKECSLSIRDSVVARNKSEGLEVSGGTLHMRNVFVTENGRHETFGGGGVSLTNVGAVDIAYATIVNNSNLAGKGDSIHCSGTSGTVRNSLVAQKIIDANMSIQCKNLNVATSLIDGGDFVGAMNVEKAASMILGLLEVDMVTAIYRWKAEATEKAARWQSGDPRVDFEGDPRPMIVDAEDYPGADVFAP